MISSVIQSFIEIAPAGLIQSLCLAILVLGVMIPFKLLDFPDLSAEGSYPLGAALSACLIYSGFSPITAIIIACIVSGIVGLGTAFIHLKYKVNTLLAGIIMSTIFYSINLRLMGGPNIALFNYDNIFDYFGNSMMSQIAVILIINLTLLVVLSKFFQTEMGLRFRSVGLSRKFSEKQGINTDRYIYVGLFFASSLCGLSGALIVQVQNYADIGIGVGIVIYALAGLMIGDKLLGTRTINHLIISPFVGALIYTQIQGLAISIGLAPTDLKLLTGIIVLATMAISYRKES